MGLSNNTVHLKKSINIQRRVRRSFIGFENFIKGIVQENHTVQLPNGLVLETREHTKEGDVKITIRPDHIEVLNKGDGVLPGEILVRTFIGKAYQYE